MAKRVKVPGVSCGFCGAPVYTTDEVIFKLAGKLARKARTSEPKGAPKSMKPCQFCHIQFSATEMRLHIPRCPDRPEKAVGRSTNPELDQKFADMARKNPNVTVRGKVVTAKKRRI